VEQAVLAAFQAASRASGPDEDRKTIPTQVTPISAARAVGAGTGHECLWAVDKCAVPPLFVPKVGLGQRIAKTDVPGRLFRFVSFRASL